MATKTAAPQEAAVSELSKKLKRGPIAPGSGLATSTQNQEGSAPQSQQAEGHRFRNDVEPDVVGAYPAAKDYANLLLSISQKTLDYKQLQQEILGRPD
jgi:hypothetical protein